MIVKLSFDKFVSIMENKVRDALGCIYEVRSIHVIKNNGINLWGLCIRCAGSSIAPNIYMNSYYESYTNGKDIEELVKDILKVYSISNKNMPSIEKNFDWESIKYDIILKLVNYDMNKETLMESPFKKVFGNLAATFHILVGSTKDGIGTAKINNELFLTFNVTLEHLYEIALANTMRWFPATIRNMNEVICTIMEEELGGSEEYEKLWDTATINDGGAEMFVLSNNTGIYGATAVLYSDILKKFSETMNTDLYIIPSSVHEIIIMLAYGREFDCNMLNEMVRNINSSHVPIEDILDNDVYMYQRSINTIISFTGH